MAPKRLSALLEGMADAVELTVTDLALSSDAVTAGSAFLAVQGTRMHGLAFAADAVARGASCVLYQPGPGAVAPDLSVPAIPVEHLRDRAGEIAARFYDHPSRALDVIAITGTDGKTSVAWLMAAAMAHLKRTAHYIGTLGMGCPEGLSATSHTTPDPISLQRALAASREAGAQAVVMEVSSHALDQRRLAGTQLRCAIFTNLGRDHLDYHASEAEYHAAKQRLLVEHAPEIAVFNADDRALREWAKRRDDAWTYALDQDARVRAVDPAFTPQGVRFQLEAAGKSEIVKAPLMGRFNVSNLAAVGATLLSLGFPLRQVVQALSRSGVVPGRMEPVRVAGKPLVIIDYAHTPQALGQALMACRAHTRGKLTVVFGCGGERDTGKRPLMGQTAAAVADRIIITDDNPRSEDPAAITAAIAEGVGAVSSSEIIHDRARAIARALEGAGPEDTILVAGKGHEATQRYGDIETPFSDRACVRQLLGVEGDA